jgi:hypothetical protein
MVDCMPTQLCKLTSTEWQGTQQLDDDADWHVLQHQDVPPPGDNDDHLEEEPWEQVEVKEKHVPPIKPQRHQSALVYGHCRTGRPDPSLYRSCSQETLKTSGMEADVWLLVNN